MTVARRVTFRPPPPTPADPFGFAVGVIIAAELQSQGVALRSWRWRYGPHERQTPFEQHRELAGRFVALEGVLDGWWPGDHRGCRCSVVPVWRSTIDGRISGDAADLVDSQAGGR